MKTSYLCRWTVSQSMHQPIFKVLSIGFGVRFLSTYFCVQVPISLYLLFLSAISFRTHVFVFQVQHFAPLRFLITQDVGFLPTTTQISLLWLTLLPSVSSYRRMLWFLMTWLFQRLPSYFFQVSLWNCWILVLELAVSWFPSWELSALMVYTSLQ